MTIDSMLNINTAYTTHHFKAQYIIVLQYTLFIIITHIKNACQGPRVLSTKNDMAMRGEKSCSPLSTRDKTALATTVTNYNSPIYTRKA